MMPHGTVPAWYFMLHYVKCTALHETQQRIEKQWESAVRDRPDLITRAP